MKPTDQLLGLRSRPRGHRSVCFDLRMDLAGALWFRAHSRSFASWGHGRLKRDYGQYRGTPLFSKYNTKPNSPPCMLKRLFGGGHIFSLFFRTALALLRYRLWH